MEKYSVYEDIAKRTCGDIYVGVVGPVRTGKSTFIQRFMEKLVIPGVAEEKRAVMTDELPQSGSGKTIMTTEPKFVPAEAVEISVSKGNPAQFEILGIMNTGEENKGIRYPNTPHGRPVINGVEKYLRILIRRKTNEN